MNIIILGPQGSGKGTQAKKIAEKYDMFYLSTGDMFRDMAGEDLNIDRMMDSGELLPDNFVIRTLKKYLKIKGVFDNFILDGIPRSVYQYQELKKLLKSKGKKIDVAILLTLSERESIRRLSNRRMDPKTGQIFNLVTAPKPRSDVDIKSLIQRDDDKPEAIKKRLNEYKKDTLPLVDELKREGILLEIDGERPIDVIHKDIINKLKHKKIKK